MNKAFIILIFLLVNPKIFSQSEYPDEPAKVVLTGRVLNFDADIGAGDSVHKHFESGYSSEYYTA